MKRILLLFTFTFFCLQSTFSQMEFVQDIRLGASASSPRDFVEYQDKIFFIAINSSGNQSIFSMDTNENITEVNSFSYSVIIQKLVVLNGEFYAIIRSIIQPGSIYSEPQLWRINFFGQDEVLNAFCGNYNTHIYDSVVYNNELYFSGSDSCLPNEFKQLYAFNGSTFRLVEAENPTGNFDPQNFAIHNNELYFRGFTGATGWELFKTNGLNVTLVRDVVPGSTSSSPFYLTSYNGSLYFAYITSVTGGTNDAQLFKLNTTTNILTPTGVYLGSDITVFDNKLHFSQRNPGASSSQLASLDTNDTLSLIPFFNTSESHLIFGFFAELDNVLYTVGRTASTDNELYKYSPGSSLKLISDYNPGNQPSNPFEKIAFNNQLYMGANSGNGLGMELHKYIPELIVTTPIADASFEQLLINLGIDSGPIDGEVPTANIESVTTLDISSMNISSISGIEDFTALQEFTSIQNLLTTLDFSSNTNLVKINVINNPITSVDVSQNTLLEELTVSTQTGTLGSIDVSQNTSLRILELGANNLSSLNVLNNTQLTYLNIGLNPITSIDLSSNLLLENIGAYSTSITNLDLSNNPNLEFVTCNNAQLTNLNIKNGNNRNQQDELNLNYLDATGNPNLLCIQVDDEVAALNNPNWFKDFTTSYSQNCSTLSIDDSTIKDLISVYPNPSKDLLNIEFFRSFIDAKATIFDTQGKHLISKNLDSNNGFIDVSKLESGIYLLTIENESISTTKRFIKQ